jgi:sugar-specific transcriptional regulator TrmB
MLVIMLALVLAPMARRLKIFNLVDFDAKLDELQKEQQETKTQLGELRNQISNVIDVQVSPTQYQTNILNLGDVTELMASLVSSKQQNTMVSTIDKKDPEQVREDFLSKAEIRRGRAFSVLVIAREFQEAILEHKAVDTEIVIGDTFDEKIHHMSKALIDRGINVLFPFTILGEKGNQVPIITSEITEGLKLMDNFLNVRQKVENREIAVPNDADELLKKIEQSILSIKGAIIFLGTNIIVSEYNMQRTLTRLHKWLDGEEGKETSKG